MGRPQKSVEALKFEGTYREDRHGSRARPDSPPISTPTPSRELFGDAKKIWDAIVPDLVEDGMATKHDGPALELFSFET